MLFLIGRSYKFFSLCYILLNLFALFSSAAQLYFVDESVRPIGTVRIVDILKLLLREEEDWETHA